MRRDKKKQKMLALFVLLLAVTLGFALLSTTLKINGTAGIKSNTWDIHWENVVPNQNSTVTAETPTITENATKVTYEVELSLPGDFYEFTVDAVNDGSINGEITDIQHTVKLVTIEGGEEVETTTTLPSYIHATLYYNGTTTPPARGDLLEAGESQTYVVRIEYDSLSEVLPESDATYRITDEITYTQTKRQRVVPDPDYSGMATNADAEPNMWFYEINNDGEKTASIVAFNKSYTQAIQDVYDYAFVTPWNCDEYDGETICSEHGYGTEWADDMNAWTTPSAPKPAPDELAHIVIPKTVPLNNEGKYAPNGGEEYTITRFYSSFDNDSSYGKNNVSTDKKNYIESNNGIAFYDMNWNVESLIIPDTITYLDGGIVGFRLTSWRQPKRLTNLPDLYTDASATHDPSLTAYIPASITSLSASQVDDVLCNYGLKVNTLYVPSTLTSIPANSITGSCDVGPNVVAENETVKQLFLTAGYSGNITVDASAFN